MVAIAEKTGYLPLEQTACREGTSFRQAVGKAEELIALLEQKGIPLSGRMMTGSATREEKERQIIIYGEKRKGVRSIGVSVSEIFKDKLNHWIGDIILFVPASISWSLGNGFEESRKWSNSRAQIVFRTYRQEETLTPTNSNIPRERIEQILQALDMAVEVIGSVGQKRSAKKDLAGTILILD